MQIEIIDYRKSNAATCLARSLHETGFAVLSHHPITSDRIEEVYQKWGDFFASDEKFNYGRNPKYQDGYFPFRSEHAKGASSKDLKEFYHVYLWGQIPPHLAEMTHRLHRDLVTIGTKLLSWLDKQMPNDVAAKLSQPLSEMMSESQQNLLRILHYPPVSSSEYAGSIRAAAHEDINLITLLLAGTKSGLQACDKAGIWHDVPCDTGMITINNGDMLALASDNYFPSTTHQVINPDEKANVSRYSMPMFLHPRGDVELKPAFTANMFLQERLKQIGLK